jgi:hypothetical protein
VTPQRKLVLRAGAGGIVALAIAMLSPYFFAGLVNDLQDARRYWLELCVATLVVGVAAVLYTVRTKERVVYGSIEIAVGFTLAFHSTSVAKAKLFQGGVWSLDEEPERMLAWLGLLGAVYVVVRGIDNFRAGAEEANRRAQHDAHR